MISEKTFITYKSGTMRNIFFFAICVIAMCACKKDSGSGGGKPLYLHKVFIDEMLTEEYIYTTDKKISRYNIYSTNLGQSNLSAFRLYEYTGDRITEMKQYNKDGALNSRRVIKYNDAGNPTRVDHYSNTEDDIAFYYVFQYSNGLLTKIQNYQPPAQASGNTINTYDAQNRLHTRKRYTTSSGSTILLDSAEFSWSNKDMPDHWHFYESMMLSFPTERTLQLMFADSIYTYVPNTPPILTNFTLSQKKYNDRGYLESQQVHVKSVAFTTAEQTFNLKYEYIE